MKNKKTTGMFFFIGSVTRICLLGNFLYLDP
jgi:hypothetical protein